MPDESKRTEPASNLQSVSSTVDFEEQGGGPPVLDDYSRLGKTEGIRPIIEDFVDRVVSDIMVGFFFKTVPIDRLKQRELEFAIAHLDGPNTYSGRPIHQAHAPHRIMGGQFNRRLRILEQTLLDHRVPADIIANWLAHNEALRSQVTVDGPFACNGELPPPASKK